jgi:hypothetical protein
MRDSIRKYPGRIGVAPDFPSFARRSTATCLLLAIGNLAVCGLYSYMILHRYQVRSLIIYLMKNGEHYGWMSVSVAYSGLTVAIVLLCLC